MSNSFATVKEINKAGKMALIEMPVIGAMWLPAAMLKQYGVKFSALKVGQQLAI